MENRKSHNEFMKDVDHAKSIPAKTCRALGPESEEDIAMYLQEHDNQTGNAKKELDELINDVNYEVGENGK